MRALIVTSSLLLLNPLVGLAAEEEGVNVVPNDVGLWIWTLATFFVMFLLLGKLAFKPIAEALDRRAKAIQQQLTDAQKDREEAKKLMADYEKQITEARGEAAKLIDEARSLSEELRKDIVEKAKAEAGVVIERAQEEIERQKEKGIQDLRDSVATLSVQIASKVIEKEVDETEHRKLVENLIQDLGKIQSAS